MNSKDVHHTQLPPRKDRRLDSLACLLQGDNVCGAACFDGKSLLAATNHANDFHHMQQVFNFLQDIAESSFQSANKSHKLKSSEKSTHYKDLQLLHDKMKTNFLKYAHKNVTLLTNHEYKANFTTALTKIIRSIRHTYFEGNIKLQENTSMPTEIVEAVRLNKIDYLSATELNHSIFYNTINPHAELKITQKLYDDNRLNQNQSVYIGISKRCCRNCEKTIAATNYVKGQNSGIVEQILVRDEGSSYPFPADYPLFLLKDKAIQAKFLQLVNKKNLNQAFHETHPDKVPAADQHHAESTSMGKSFSSEEDIFEANDQDFPVLTVRGR